MLKRILTTIALWSTLCLMLYLIGPGTGVWLLLILSTLATHELCNILKHMGYQPLKAYTLLCGGLLFLFPYYAPHYIEAETILAMIFILLGLMLLYRPTDINWLKKSLIPTFWALCTIPYLLHFFIKIFQHTSLHESPYTALCLIIWSIAMAKFTDVGGLLGGMLIGKTPLAPHISPKKTWEGALCGIGLSCIIGLMIYTVLKNNQLIPENLTFFKAFVINIIIACVSIPSDLFESVLKRMADIKDSGNTLPGIGGAFDLADSLLFIAPIFYGLLNAFVL